MHIKSKKRFHVSSQGYKYTEENRTRHAKDMAALREDPAAAPRPPPGPPPAPTLADARAALRARPTAELALAVALADAARALRAAVHGDLAELTDAARHVGRAPTASAVALLMGRHPRLGARSPLRRVPEFVMRYILSILGAPFDLLNDRLTVRKYSGSVSVGFCGVTWRIDLVHGGSWIPNAQGPLRAASGGAGGVRSTRPPPPPHHDSGRDPQDSQQAQLIGGGRPGGTRHEYDRNRRRWKKCCAAALGVADNLATLVTHGDTLLHVACRVAGGARGSGDAGDNHRAVARWLAGRACRLVRNAHGELPRDVAGFLPARSTLMTTGVATPVGDPRKSFPSTGAFAACADLLADPVDRPAGSVGWVHDVTVLLGKPLPAGTNTLVLCACTRVEAGVVARTENKNDDDGVADDKDERPPATFVVTAVSTCRGLEPRPAFQQNRGYLLTDEQTLRVTPPLRVPGGCHLALVNPRGSLNITCGLGSTKRHRVVAASLPDLTAALRVGGALPCGGERKGCCGWRCSVQPMQNTK